MTDDHIIRGAITAISIPIIGLVIQKAKAKLSAARDKEGRRLTERIGYRLGNLWARANKAAK